jgi:hypothetical protein
LGIAQQNQADVQLDAKNLALVDLDQAMHPLFSWPKFPNQHLGRQILAHLVEVVE